MIAFNTQAVQEVLLVPTFLSVRRNTRGQCSHFCIFEHLPPKHVCITGGRHSVNFFFIFFTVIKQNVKNSTVNFRHIPEAKVCEKTEIKKGGVW